MHKLNRVLNDVAYGAAVGDALGVPYEFLERDTFECADMVGDGTHHQPAGTFSDDTSLLLATCNSIRRQGGRIDVDDMRACFETWLYQGGYAIAGKVFDVGNATATALDASAGRTGEHSNGNGSLMRIAPLAFTQASDDQVRAVSAITHAHRISCEACVCYVHVLRAVLDGMPVRDALAQSIPSDDEFLFLHEVLDYERSQVKSGGYVLDTLGAAFWCADTTDSYADCVLAAVNLGGDTDTTACVAGALAGALYGKGAIPEKWLRTLRGIGIIEACMF